VAFMFHLMASLDQIISIQPFGKPQLSRAVAG
jgi:hypothetical protein